MLLTNVYLHGYKRFKEKQNIQIDGRLTCILGPNESGKSSFFEALLHLNAQSAFQTSGPSKEIHRDSDFSENHVILTAAYLIEKDDWQAISYIDGAEKLKWLRLNKRVDGTLRYELTPRIVRTTKHMDNAVSQLLNQKEKWSKLPLDKPKEFEEALQQLSVIVETGKADERRAVVFNSLQVIRQRLSSTDAPEAVDVLPSIDMAIKYESLESPELEAIRVLSNKIASFAIFTSEDLLLKSDYQLHDFFREKDRKAIPIALQNFSILAGIDLEKVFKYTNTDDTGRLQSHIDNANNLISERLASAWGQTELTVKVLISASKLSIHVSNDGADLEKLAMRSDGLRQFLALTSFVYSKKFGNKSILLLIDELEQHLHYDAQADLVQMLTAQKVVRQIIYSTHSIGCLPEDLGCGVRALKFSDNNSCTKIVNNFWHDESPGLSPLLVNMGAATMAFIPTRNCVLTEGPSDFLLFPALFREVTGLKSLGIQFSPGLSVANDEHLKILQNVGRRVLHIVDGDDGGRALKAQLERIEINSEDIFSLTSVTVRDSVIEDLIVPSTYCEAVNAEFDRWEHDIRVDPKDLPDFMRPNFVKELCTDAGVQPPSKVAVAYRVLEKRFEQKLLDENYAESMRELFSEMKERQLSSPD